MSNLPLTVYRVFWSCGPHDNPQDGTFTVDAYCLLSATHKAATHAGDGIPGHESLDAIVRADLCPDLSPVRLRPIIDDLAAALASLRGHEGAGDRNGRPSAELQHAENALDTLRDLAGITETPEPR